MSLADFCGCGIGSKTLDTRPTEARSVVRRRQCPACGVKFTTVEVPVLLLNKVLNMGSGPTKAKVKEALKRAMIKGL